MVGICDTIRMEIILNNFFIDQRCKKLSSTARILLLYMIFGHRATASACYELPQQIILQDLELPKADIELAINELINHNIITKSKISEYYLINIFFDYRPILDYKEAVTTQSQATVLPIDKELYWLYYHLIGQQIAATKTFAVKSKRQASKITDDPAYAGRMGRGTRITEEWRPTRDNIDYAIKSGFSESDAFRIGEKFKDYWLQKAGQQARKSDWNAAWRTWIRNSINDKRDQSPERLRDKFLNMRD